MAAILRSISCPGLLHLLAASASTRDFLILNFPVLSFFFSVGINPNEFWDQVIGIISLYLEEPKDLELDLNLEYFNTPSASKLFSLLRLVDNKMGDHKKMFTVIWHDDNDEDNTPLGSLNLKSSDTSFPPTDFINGTTMEFPN